MEETKLTAALPNLDIQILHREDKERGAEIITMQITATPSFDAVRGMIGPAFPMMGLWAAPMQAWSAMVQQAWAPWLSAFAPNRLPPKKD
ncbi:hypothetical protein [Azospirillum soli]|uniref:hypothetical protein n=1 Tax=Azospirillum soli TaxID=1304799 RepID=UPI001AE5B00C|nr:hypothetical protein [Azospirillum soli]MBP2315790.1 hypothetical protein [Azospirillum soli]